LSASSGTTDSMVAQGMQALIDATKQERQRIEEPKNRSRYFIFGRIDEKYTEKGYSATFENAPDRVVREARWAASRDERSLFRVGDIFVPGRIEINPQGLRLSFLTSDLSGIGIDVAAVRRISEIGIDYVMDNRKLMEHLLAFLELKARERNEFLHSLIQVSEPIPIRPIAKAINYADLNPSQRNGIEKALKQRVTFFWGPPGTGKTKTMGALAASLVHSGKRVLLTALSNMALDQLLLSTCERLRSASISTSIARLGSTMDERCRAFSREAFKGPGFLALRAGMKWSEHVRNSSLVAGTSPCSHFPERPTPDNLTTS